MNWYCPQCGEGTLYGDDVPMCPIHIDELVPYEPPTAGPDTTATDIGGGDDVGSGAGSAGAAAAPQTTTRAAGAVSWDRSRCWNCGTAPPSSANTECLNPACRRRLIPPALLLRFPAGEVEIDPGASAELGRLGAHARLFRSHLNVSRRHAVVGVEADGSAWIEPCATPNGTFVDGAEIPPLARRPLRTGQQVRFAMNAEGVATVYAM